jgi:lysophospholipase L1-like esterase
MGRKLALAGGSVVLGLFVLEMVLRWLMPPLLPGVATMHTPNARFASWALPPRTWMTLADPDTGRVIPFRTNARGWKDRDHTLAKPRGVFRIVVLGDSYTYGLVAIEQQYTSRLEAMLRQNGWPQCEVISIGVSGWGTDQSLEALIAEGLLYQPDLVIYQFCSNDLLENLYPEPGMPLPTPFHRVKHFRYHRRPEGGLEKVALAVQPPKVSSRKRLRSVLRNSALVCLVERAARAGEGRATGAILDGAGVSQSEEFHPDSPYFLYAAGEEPPGTRRAWDLLDALVGRMAEVARSHGAELVVFSESGDEGRRRWFLEQRLIGSGPDGDLLITGEAPRPIDLQRPLKNLARICAEAQIPLILPRRVYTRYHNDSHTNAAGNERMAADIAAYLTHHPRLATTAESGAGDVVGGAQPRQSLVR